LQPERIVFMDLAHALCRHIAQGCLRATYCFGKVPRNSRPCRFSTRSETFMQSLPNN
jgi:hypothetical protein